jgi:hypothetical protein
MPLAQAILALREVARLGGNGCVIVRGMATDTPATAEGDLGRTPFAHLLVYALDKRLTGAMFLTEPGSEAPHVVRFVRGAAVKVRPADRYSLLGEMLVEAGALSDKTLADALATKGLLGDVLLLAGCVERDLLESTCVRQFEKRMVRLFQLPAGTQYRYYDGHAELEDYGGEAAEVDPLALLWKGIAAHGGPAEAQERTLARLGDAPIRLHPQATSDRLLLSGEALDAMEQLKKGPISMGALLALGVAPEEVVKRLLYALLITRQIETSANLIPAGAEAAPSSAREGAAAAAAAVGRVVLKATTYRLGAAAPDQPGTGERSSEVARTSSEPCKPKSDPSKPRASTPQLPAPPTVKALPSPPKEAETLRSMEPIRAPTPARQPELAVLSAPALYQLAMTKLGEHDLEGALEACSSARLAAPGEPDYGALSVWIRLQMSGADLKSLSVEIDDLLREHEGHVQARYYRALLRRKLGDDTAAIRDLTRVLELSPSHAEAARELEILAPRKAPARTGLLGWLFKR